MLSRYLQLRPSVLRAQSPLTFRLPPTINQLLTNANINQEESTTVSGWVKSIRKQKNVAFAVVTDGSSDKGLQAVLVKKKGTKEEDDLVKRLTNGAAVRLTGKLVESPGTGQSHELLVEEAQEGSIVVLGECAPEEYPIQKKLLSNEYLRDNVHLRARTSQIASMIRLRNTLNQKLSSWFDTQGFHAVNTPILTANDAEGAGESFRLAPFESSHPAATLSTSTPTTSPQPSEFFSRPAHLTVSSQLHLEALATALSRVYTLSPCFRAEPSLTGRHLAEFWMLEAEWAFIDQQPSQVNKICDFVEATIRNAVAPLINTESIDPDIKALWTFSGDEGRHRLLQDTFQSKEWWPRMTYTEAIRELQNSPTVSSFTFKPEWGKQLQSEHERWIAETLVKGPVFITDYPISLKPFYMRENDDGKTVACFDLLVPHIGELVGGSVREERANVLRKKMEAAGLVDAVTGDAGAYKWYEDLRKHGGAPHAGFGMGFERLVGWVSGLENIRECIPMPRWAGRLLL